MSLLRSVCTLFSRSLLLSLCRFSDSRFFRLILHFPCKQRTHSLALSVACCLLACLLSLSRSVRQSGRKREREKACDCLMIQSVSRSRGAKGACIVCECVCLSASDSISENLDPDAAHVKLPASLPLTASAADSLCDRLCRSNRATAFACLSRSPGASDSSISRRKQEKEASSSLPHQGSPARNECLASRNVCLRTSDGSGGSSSSHTPRQTEKHLLSQSIHQ